MNLVGKEGNKWHGIKKTAIFVKFVSGIVLRTDFFFLASLNFYKIYDEVPNCTFVYEKGHISNSTAFFFV